MAIGRALLARESLDAAEGFLRGAPASGGFHFALTHRRDRRILSVEFGGGETSIIEVTAPALHANHALHHRGGLAAQIVTRSSGDRQARGDALVATGREPFAILRDTGGPGLPIRRDAPDDPDHENTLATALFRVEDRGVEWRIHDDADGPAAYAGTTA
ncbi:carcinine hydrolase/isopenicillin-N N-acyltransferase family protein, partial [Amaricoccus sp.]|uniref:carcinine hydrolase/isopenicillin-N N-acyltransferase family protein n=1 Tax=Amaricoccus sp. TaxID=1872485 RepID=UPI00260A32B0